MVGDRHVRSRRGLIGEYDLGNVGRRPEFAGVMVVGSPASGAGCDKRLHSRGLAREREIGLESGHEQGRAAQTPAQHGPPPVQARLLELRGLAIGAQRMLADQMQAGGHEVENLLIPKPTRSLAMHFQGRRLEEEDMAAVLQGSHVGVERFPVVADQRQPTGSSELLGYLAQLQDRCQRVPAQGLDRLGLAQGLQEADAAAVGIQSVNVVKDQW